MMQINPGDLLKHSHQSIVINLAVKNLPLTIKSFPNQDSVNFYTCILYTQRQGQIT